jgi:hypothetical protein
MKNDKSARGRPIYCVACEDRNNEGRIDRCHYQNRVLVEEVVKDVLVHVILLRLSRRKEHAFKDKYVH